MEYIEVRVVFTRAELEKITQAQPRELTGAGTHSAALRIALDLQEKAQAYSPGVSKVTRNER